MQYKHLLFDLDHTLWDFDKNSYEAFQYMFSTHGLDSVLSTSFDSFHSKYIIHNKHYWSLYSQGGISQAELRWRRMYETLRDFDHTDEHKARHMSETYLDYLPTSKKLFPHTLDVLEYLLDKGYRMHIVSNGFEKTQQLKLKHSGLQKFFTHIVTSEASGFVKPDKKIFEHCLALAGSHITESIMIGDSPEADLTGANNAGMDSIYVDHHSVHTGVPYTYSVKNLLELKEIF